MPRFVVTSPEGKNYEVVGPDGSTQADAIAQVQQQLTPPSGPSAVDRGKRVAGLGARSVIDAITGVPALMADAVSEGVNAGSSALGADYRMQKPSQALSALLTKLGLPEAETPVERFSTSVSSAMGGAGGQARLAAEGIKNAASPLIRKIAEKFAEAPGMQVASAGAGAAGGDIARESGAGFWGQLAATLGAGMSPAAVKSGGAAGVRGAIRGGEEGRQTVENNLRTFNEAGTTPTVGQATEGRGNRLTETLLSKTPGSAGVVANKATTQAAEIGGKVDELAGGISKDTGAAPAGRAIQQGIKGEDTGFVSWFKARQSDLYNKLDQYIPADTRVDVNRTKQALETLNADIPGAPNLSQWFKNGRIQGIQQALESDVSQKGAYTPSQLKGATEANPQRAQDLNTALQEGKLPYEAVKKLRTLVGDELANPSLMSDVPRSKWKALYGALSEDMRSAAQQAGPDAEHAWERANAHTAAGMKRIDVLNPIANAKDPEAIFKMATSGMKEGASTINAVMKSVPPESQNALAATVLKRMGQAKSGVQNDIGDVFSTETFLTNWNNISPQAKLTLFSRYGTDFVKNLDDIAKTASNLRAGSKVFANPSGTEAALSARMGAGGVLFSFLTGHPAVGAELLAGMGAAHVGSKYLMTNPDFVRWLAQTTKAPAGAVPGQLAALESMALKQPPEERKAMLDYAGELRTRAQPQGR